jgi:hypothetical protein
VFRRNSLYPQVKILRTIIFCFVFQLGRQVIQRSDAVPGVPLGGSGLLLPPPGPRLQEDLQRSLQTYR